MGLQVLSQPTNMPSLTPGVQNSPFGVQPALRSAPVQQPTMAPIVAPVQQPQLAPQVQKSPLGMPQIASIGTATDQQSYTPKLSMQEFAQTIKQKYPQYADRPDDALAKAMLAKYPEYQSKVFETQQPQQETQKHGFLANALLGLTSPFRKGLASGYRALQATPDLIKGIAGDNSAIDRFDQKMAQPALGSKTLAGSSNLENLGSAVSAASYLIPGSKLLTGGFVSGVGGALEDGQTNVGEVLKSGAAGAVLARVVPLLGKAIPSGAKQVISQQADNILTKISGPLATVVKPVTSALEARTVGKRVSVLSDLENRYAGVSDVVDNATKKGVDVKRIVAQSNLLQDAVNSDGLIKPELGIKKVQQLISPVESVVGKALKQEGRKIPLQMVGKQMQSAVENSTIEGAARISALKQVKQELEGLALRADKDGYVPLHVIHDLKVYKGSNVNYLNPDVKQADKVITNGLKTFIEKNSKSVDVQGLNKDLSQLYTVKDYLEALDGKRVKGGRLGKYFAQTLGAVVGSHFGPLGSVAGAELGGRVKGAGMARSFGGASGKELTASEKLLQAAGQAKGKVIELPQSSNSLGSRNMSQSNTSMVTNIKSGLGKVNSYLNDSIPGLGVKDASKRVITYVDKDGKQKVIKGLTKEDASNWTAWLQRQGLKYSIRAAGALATIGAIKHGSDRNN